MGNWSHFSSHFGLDWRTSIVRAYFENNKYLWSRYKELSLRLRFINPRNDAVSDANTTQMWLKWLEETGSTLKTRKHGRRIIHAKPPGNVLLVSAAVERSPRQTVNDGGKKDSQVTLKGYITEWVVVPTGWYLEMRLSSNFFLIFKINVPVHEVCCETGVKLASPIHISKTFVCCMAVPYHPSSFI